jgi:AraC-like DNA-binding protein
MATICTLLSEIDLTDALRPLRVSTGEVVYPSGGTLGPRRQRDIELVLVQAGSARVAVDDEPPLRLAPGTVGLLLPGHREWFEFDAHEETRHSWVQLGVADPVPAEIAGAPRQLGASAALVELVRYAVDAPSGQLATALAMATIWRYVADAEAAPDEGGIVERARRHVELRLTDPDLTLDRLAASVHVTPAHLVRRFRAELGITPMAYLWQRRVARGVELLTNTGLSVAEVARRSGFRSVYHFSRRVKHATGVPPTELRARRWSAA